MEDNTRDIVLVSLKFVYQEVRDIEEYRILVIQPGQYKTRHARSSGGNCYKGLDVTDPEELREDRIANCIDVKFMRQ